MPDIAKTPNGATVRRWNASHSAMLAFAATAVILAAAHPDGGDAWVVPALAAATGGFVGIFHAKRYKALLACTMTGLLVGVVSSIDLLRYDVEGKFGVIAATLGVFLAIGLVFGTLAQFVLYLHHLTHDSKAPGGRKG